MVLLAGCAGDPGPLPDVGPAVELRAASFNVARLRGAASAAAVADVLREAEADVVALQECGACAATIEGLGLTMIGTPRAGVAIAYDAARLEPIDDDVVILGDDDDGWGPRPVAAILRAGAGGRAVAFYATHFCVPTRSADDACDVERQLAYADTLIADLAARVESPAVVAGDLNVSDGFAAGPVLAALAAAGMVDTFAALHPDDPAPTFVGNGFAPAGRVDFVLARAPGEARAAAIHDDGPAAAAASDHFAVSATIGFPAAARE